MFFLNFRNRVQCCDDDEEMLLYLCIMKFIFFVILGIFLKSNLGKAIKEKLLDFPPPKRLPNSDIVCPSVVLGDEAFPLLENLLKPYPRQQGLHDRTKAVFNYRLSRARRITENAFGRVNTIELLNTKILLIEKI